jgi:hypothetical protein
MGAFLPSGPLGGALPKQLKKNALTCFFSGVILKSSVSKGTGSGLWANGCFSNDIRVDNDAANGAVFARLQGDPMNASFNGCAHGPFQTAALDGYLSEKGDRFGSVAGIDVLLSVFLEKWQIVFPHFAEERV